ncbi:hypothetical protein EMGR_005604 [Emarellia grisea]
MIVLLVPLAIGLSISILTRFIPLFPSSKLNFTAGQIFDHPNLQQVQAEGLSAFWLMSMGHVNRAWRTCGVSMRSAIALGINLRSESKDTPNFARELQ